jgi:hypothetical protein
MTGTPAGEVPSTDRPPGIGPLFQWLVWASAIGLVVGEAFGGRFVSLGAGFVTLVFLSAVLAVVAGLFDRFRPGIFVGWWTVLAVIMAVLVVAAPTAGSSDWNIPLIFATSVDATGASVPYMPLLQTFANPPSTIFLTISGFAFWALVWAWFLSLRARGRSPRR